MQYPKARMRAEAGEPAHDTLTAAMVRAGRRVLEHLDRAGRRVPFGLWVFFPGRRAWRLVIAAPGVRTGGRAAVTAGEIERLAAGSARDAGAPALRPLVLDLDHPFVSLVRRGAPPPPRLRERRVRDLVVDGVRIPHLYLYRL